MAQRAVGSGQRIAGRTGTPTGSRSGAGIVAPTRVLTGARSRGPSVGTVAPAGGAAHSPKQVLSEDPVPAPRRWPGSA